MKSIFSKPWIPWAIAAAAGILIVLFVFRKVPLPGADPVRDRLQKQNENLLKRDQEKEIKLKNSDRVIDSLESIIQNNNGKIKKIYIDVERKVAVYDSFSVEQLERIIADRYR